MTDDDEEERKDEQIIKKTLSSLAKSLVNMVKLDCSLKFLLFKSFLCRSLQGNMAKVSRYWPIVKSCANFSLLILDFFLGLQFELFFRIHGWLFFWWHYCNVYILPVQIAYLWYFALFKKKCESIRFLFWHNRPKLNKYYEDRTTDI